MYNGHGSKIWSANIIIMPMHEGSLAPLTFEVEWIKLRIEDYSEEDLEEDLDFVLCCCLEEVNYCWGLGDLVWMLVWDLD
jgi:hypothetical protein